LLVESKASNVARVPLTRALVRGDHRRAQRLRGRRHPGVPTGTGELDPEPRMIHPPSPQSPTCRVDRS
jgi:hypothetical protein